MKRILSFALLLTITSAALFSQVFNTASTLKAGRFNIGVEPVVYSNAGNNDFYLFLNAGVGLIKGTDLNVKLGVLGNDTYIGGDVEFNINKFFSIGGGAHSFGEFGLDGTGLLTFPLGPAKLYTGLDVDIVFGNETTFPLWIPVGVEFFIKKKMAFIFEAEIGATNDTPYHVIGGGLNFYL